jgi:Cu-Zn family superoxide dismutase
MKRFILSPFMALAIASGATTATGQDVAKASANFVDGKGNSTGKATLTGTAEGVLIDLQIIGLPSNQWVAFHVHETGSCDPATGHESAGSHLNISSRQHGFLADGGPHIGDMPNQYVGADGVLRAQVFNSFVRLNGTEATLKGRALMIHAKADDYRSQPSGDAGARLACGVIE